MRVLIVRMSALGDIVHALPAAAALRRAYPAARIDWLVGAKHREILDLVPILDTRIAIRDRRGSNAGAGVAAAIGELRRARYDAAIDLQGLIKSALLARASGAKAVLGFGARQLREPLARMFYTRTHDSGDGLFDRREGRHIVDVNLALLETLGVPAGPREFPIAEVRSAVADSMHEGAGGRYALLNPGAAWPNKRWPPARLAALARQLRDRYGLRSVVLWGPGEEALAREVAAAAGGAALVSPATTIADVVALARGAAVMVSGDTGPTHLAAAVGTPLVGIYGPTRPERNGPWAPGDLTVSRADVCVCHHLRQCRRGEMCLLDIPVEEVLHAVEQRLGLGVKRA